MNPDGTVRQDMNIPTAQDYIKKTEATDTKLGLHPNPIAQKVNGKKLKKLKRLKKKVTKRT